MGQGKGRGCCPEQLAATVPCALFTVDASQWRGAHSLWPYSVNILEHSGCSGGPGALYLNNIILYIDTSDGLVVNDLVRTNESRITKKCITVALQCV